MKHRRASDSDDMDFEHVRAFEPKRGGTLTRINAFASLIIFVVGSIVGFVVQSVRTDATLEAQMQAIQKQHDAIHAEFTELRGLMVTQAQHQEVITRLDRSDRILQQLLDESATRVTIRRFIHDQPRMPQGEGKQP